MTAPKRGRGIWSAVRRSRRVEPDGGRAAGTHRRNADAGDGFVGSHGALRLLGRMRIALLLVPAGRERLAGLVPIYLERHVALVNRHDRPDALHSAVRQLELDDRLSPKRVHVGLKSRTKVFRVEHDVPSGERWTWRPAWRPPIEPSR